MLNQFEVCDRFVSYIREANSWDDFFDWYQSIQPNIAELMWQQFTGILFHHALYHQRIDFIKFIFAHKAQEVIDHFIQVEMRHLNVFLFMQNQEIFEFIYEMVPINIKSFLCEHFSVMAFHALQSADFFLFSRILDLSPKYLVEILSMNDYMLFYMAIESDQLYVIDYVITHAGEHALNYFESQKYHSLRELVEKGYLGTLVLIFDAFPGNINQLIKANNYQLFKIAVEYNQIEIVNYLLELKPNWRFKMIRADRFDAFMQACEKGYEQLVLNMFEAWRTHIDKPMQVLTYKDFLSLKILLSERNQEIAMALLPHVYHDFESKARLQCRCDFFELALSNDNPDFALLLLERYEADKVDITLSLISVFQQSNYAIDIRVLRKIMPYLDDDIMIESLSVDGFERLKFDFNHQRFEHLDIIFANFHEVEYYQECLKELQKNHPEHLLYLEVHQYLASIQDFILSIIENKMKTRLPQLKSVLDLYPEEKHEAVAFYLQKYIDKLPFFSEHFATHIQSVQPLIEILLNQKQEKCYPHYQFFYLNLSIMNLIARANVLPFPILSCRKWQDYQLFLQAVQANLTGDLIGFVRLMRHHLIDERLRVYRQELFSDVLMALNIKYNNQINSTQANKIKSLLVNTIVNQDLLEQMLDDNDNGNVWISYKVLTEIALEALHLLKPSQAEYKMLNKILQFRDYHPINVEFMTILPVFCHLFANRYDGLSIHLLDHLLLNTETKLKCAPLKHKELLPAMQWYLVRYTAYQERFPRKLMDSYLESLLQMMTTVDESHATILSAEP